MSADPAEEFLVHWFDLWLSRGIEAANAHFPNAGPAALGLAKRSAYSFMDAHPEAVHADRWAERWTEQ